MPVSHRDDACLIKNSESPSNSMSSLNSTSKSSSNQTNPKNLRFILGACFTSYNIGCTFGFTSPSIYELEELTHLCHTVKYAKESYAGSVNIGIVIGAIITSLFCKKLSPREILLWSSLPTLLGWSLSLMSLTIDMVGSLELWMLILGRVLLGVAGGFSTVVCPGFLLKSEYCEGLSGLFQVSLIFGVFMQQVLSFWLGELWILVLVNLVNGFLVIGGLFEIQEMTDIIVEAGTEPGNTSETDPHLENIEFSQNNIPESVPWWLSLVLAAGQQLSGLNAFNFYLNQIFSDDTENSQNETLSYSTISYKIDPVKPVHPISDDYPMIITAAQVLVTAISSLLLYKKCLFSNKSNMLVSCWVVLTSLVVMAVFLHLELENFYLMFPTIAFQIGFSFGLGPTTWTIIARAVEEHDNHLLYRSQAAAVNSITSFLVVFSFYPIIEVGSKSFVFVVYSGMMAIYFGLMIVML